ncbi:MAG: methyl-accepting chemotaxis protein [Clostridiales bacterium]|jgi:methyl-accepting chemotaxis protein|nr:methyl-accepting chemotaxis protein [Clostridiales bacterium]
MSKLNLKSKILIPVVILQVLLVAVLTVFASFRFTGFADDMTVSQIERLADNIKNEIEDHKVSAAAAAKACSEDIDISVAIKTNNREKLQELLLATLNTYGVTYYTVADAEGNVILRSYDFDNYGDSVLSQQNVKDALEGKYSTYIESGTAIKVSIRSGAPIVDSLGRVIAVISAGVRYDTEEMVDRLKTRQGGEFTVFYGDERVATTIVQNGQRAVGTKLTDTGVLNAVLENGQEYIGDTNIFGEPYKAFYMPFKNPSGEPFAILFYGSSQSEVIAMTNSFIITIIIIGAAALAIIAITLILIMNNVVSKPISQLVDVAESVAAGNLNINIDTSRADETGKLARSFSHVVGSVNGLVQALEGISHKYSVEGDIDAKVDVSLFQGSYKHVAENINGLTDILVNTTIDFINCIIAFGNGDFNANINKLPGKMSQMNETVDKFTVIIKGINKGVTDLVTHAINGKLSDRIDADAYGGDWKTLVSGMNTLMEAVAAPINEVSDVMAHVTEGDFSRMVSGDYKGDFLSIKESVNNTVINVASYIEEIARVLTGLAANNLNQEIKREYVGSFQDIKYALNNITDTLNKVIGDMNRAAEQVSSGAKQIAESSMSLAQGSTEQASSIQELTAAVISVNEKTRANADSANSASVLAGSLKDHAIEGNRQMKDMLNSMREISEASGSISKIIDIIRDISFQTDLLALNASIEAAHAGVHGAGFSVVAEEVRSLAVKSQKAANDTTGLIETSVQRVKEGTEIANRTDAALETIVGDVDAMASIIDDISAASGEQSQAISQINEGVTEIARVVQDNSASSEESAAAAQELSSQSEIMKNMVGVFTLK